MSAAAEAGGISDRTACGRCADPFGNRERCGRNVERLIEQRGLEFVTNS